MKNQVERLIKYQDHIKSRLSDSSIPEKHKNRPESYKRFLKNELEQVTKQIEALRLGQK